MNCVYLCILLSICLISSSFALPFYSKRELAPSLTLHRINALKDTIDQLNDIKKAMRCRERANELASKRSKRMISPSLRLSELIDPLVTGESVPNEEAQMPSIDDECVGFYHDIPYYF
uniref:BHLH domain-containing protein n=1 Tax=Caenorhabditis tropicalis TaxID=1561998 RepID=A0A1I7UG83_9PELO